MLPPGLDQFAVYTGLIDSALELGKLMATEQRDLHVIERSYKLEMAAMTAAFEEVEAAMQADFARDNALRDRTFESINLLISAGQFEIASEFHKRMIDGFSRPALETIIAHRNGFAAGSGLELRMR
jgi:hypothetical protein